MNREVAEGLPIEIRILSDQGSGLSLIALELKLQPQPLTSQALLVMRIGPLSEGILILLVMVRSAIAVTRHSTYLATAQKFCVTSAGRKDTLPRTVRRRISRETETLCPDL